MKALEQDNHELRSVGGRSSETTSLSDIPETAASTIATNATTAMMEEMRRERKKTVAMALAEVSGISLRLVFLLLLPPTDLSS